VTPYEIQRALEGATVTFVSGRSDGTAANPGQLTSLTIAFDDGSHLTVEPDGDHLVVNTSE
jgi:hypothetical protein